MPFLDHARGYRPARSDYIYAWPELMKRRTASGSQRSQGNSNTLVALIPCDTCKVLLSVREAFILALLPVFWENTSGCGWQGVVFFPNQPSVGRSYMTGVSRVSLHHKMTLFLPSTVPSRFLSYGRNTVRVWNLVICHGRDQYAI
jgi:hypothetical protein